MGVEERVGMEVRDLEGIRTLGVTRELGGQSQDRDQGLDQGLGWERIQVHRHLYHLDPRRIISLC